MNIVVCIDDTDNLESPGTGHLANDLKRDIERLYDGKTSLISRHQLLFLQRSPILRITAPCVSGPRLI